ITTNVRLMASPALASTAPAALQIAPKQPDAGEAGRVPGKLCQALLQAMHIDHGHHQADA
ncbi:hypothetical protein, partial [Acinetobacter baumannii]|uniref:hypothetical protein n=1 Tax=Acinetobacter baumannii TaxID=470 RepID=UPI001C0A2360